MSIILTLVFIGSVVGIWYSIKKKPDKNIRNICIGVAVIAFALIGLTGNSNGKEESSETTKTSETTEIKESSSTIEKTKTVVRIEAPAELEADEQNKATITGKATPEAKVTVGLGIIGDSTTADKDGNFTLNYEHTDENEKELTLYATLDGESENTKVKIKPNQAFLAKKAEERQAAEAAKKAEEDRKAAEAALPTEHKSALVKAKQYSDSMYMSKAGLYEQLTSEYGEKFSAEAAQYAIDNLQADYNKNALEKAKSYQSQMAMSPEAIRDQLTSEYGEQFTPEEADYAIANLN